MEIVKVGDKIKFCDNEITPIIHNIKFISDKNSYLEGVYPDSNYGRMMIKAKICYDNILTEYEVLKIEKQGHLIKYILGINGNIVFSCSEDWSSFNYYPEIHGNKFMKQILELYNN